MDPINYSVDVATPFQSALQGYQAGATIRNDQFAQQQQQLAVQQQQQQRATLQALMAKPNPTASDFANATVLIPGMKDQFKQAWDMRNTDQQQSDLSHSGQVYAALQAGQPDVATQILTDRATALRNSGNEADAKHADVMAGVIQEHPELAKAMVGMQLASIPGGDKVINGAAGLGAETRAQALAPPTLAKAQADASTAQTTADVAAGTAPEKVVAAGLENDKTLQDIQASKLNGQIAQLNTQIAQANSETERGKLVLERDKMVQQLQQTQQAKSQSAQDVQDGATQALQTLGQIKTHPGMESFFTGPGTKWGAVWGKVPGSDRQALNGWVDSLKGQLGYSNLMAAKASSPTGASGFGALSEGELKLLSGLAANLDPNSSDFPKQLASVEHYLQKTQSTAAARPNLPTTGGAFVMTSPKYGVIKEGDINRLMVAHPGATREQILNFLNQAK